MTAALSPVDAGQLGQRVLDEVSTVLVGKRGALEILVETVTRIR